MEKQELKKGNFYTIPQGEKQFVIINNVAITGELIELLSFVQNYNSNSWTGENNNYLSNEGFNDFDCSFAELFSYLYETLELVGPNEIENRVKNFSFVTQTYKNLKTLKAPYEAYELLRKLQSKN